MSNRKENTPYFPALQAFFRGRPNISYSEAVQRKIKDLKSMRMAAFRQLFSGYIPAGCFRNNSDGDFSRNRVYSLEITFWGFLNQIFLNNSSCSAVVKKIQRWMLFLNKRVPSSATGAYCKAKKKISLTFLKNIFDTTASAVVAREKDEERVFGRVVKVVDGTGLSMPDTPKNQKVYPQNGAMKKGCGFPQLNMVAVFSLVSGALLGYAEGGKCFSEQTLWRRLWKKLLKKGDIVLGDRGYLSYANVAVLGRMGVDSVLRWKDRIKKIKSEERLGANDCIYSWSKPASKPSSWTEEEFRSMPAKLRIRIIESRITRNGFRTEHVKIATTLLEPEKYPAEELVKLYFKRWSVELRLRDIKTTMGMDVLKGKSPRQVKKEIAMFAIAYNLLRGLMLDTARHCMREIDRISFADTLQQLTQWMDMFLSAGKSVRRMLIDFYYHLAQKIVPDRPGRNEPRAKKRRPKNFKLMTLPRGEMIIDCHRNNPGRKNAFFMLK